MNVKTILISQFSLPYEGIGSWTTMYNYYLNHNHSIDIIIGPTPKQKIKNISYYSTEKTFVDKIKSKAKPLNRYQHIFKILNKVIESSNKYIIQLIDNHGVVEPLNDFLIKNNIRNQCYIQFFYHGYAPFYGNFQSRNFFEIIDEHIVLTNDSYKEHQKTYTVLPCAFNVLHNGVNSDDFYVLDDNERKRLREKNKVSNENLIFIWCSQDRPKKGLDFILKVWKRISEKHKNAELWIIGSNRTFEAKQIRNIGKLPNNKLAEYYQMADFYLFPSLWHEGFGLSLVEALKCGCYCIASQNGGIPEVLQYGKYGKLIERPNFIQDWINEIENSIQEYKLRGNPYLKNLPNNLYELENWCTNMNTLINEAKKNV